MAVVMVVDDDSEVRQLIHTIVEKTGHTVVACADAAQAWQNLDQNPDVMFLDIDMPGETGVQFLLRLREHPKYVDLPVVFVTAFRERARPLQATGRGAVEIIDKPFRLEEIQATLESVLDGEKGAPVP